MSDETLSFKNKKINHSKSSTDKKKKKKILGVFFGRRYVLVDNMKSAFRLVSKCSFHQFQ